MKVGDLVKMVERYVPRWPTRSWRTLGGEPMELGIVVDIRKQVYKVLWSDSIRSHPSFQVEAVSGEYVEVVE